MIDVAEGRRLKAAAEKAWEEYFDPAETPVASTPEAIEKAEVAEHDWGEWLANNLYALLDAAERAEAAERELSEAREGLQAGRDLMAVVHGDGGHYREQYGDRKASEDAIILVDALRVAYDDALRKFLEAQADSERYRWLREHVSKGGLTVAKAQAWSLDPWSGDDLDAAIDAERGKA